MLRRCIILQSGTKKKQKECKLYLLEMLRDEVGIEKAKVATLLHKND